MPSEAILVDAELVAAMETARVQTAQNKQDSESAQTAAEAAAGTAAQDAADAVAALLASQVAQSGTNASTAQTAASQAQTFRNDAAGFAAMALGGPYLGSYASKSAFNSALPGLAAGLYSVYPDESQNGSFWVYRVNASHALVGTGYAVPVLNASDRGMDLAGTLVNRGTADNRQILLIPKYAPQGVDFAITKNVTAQPVGGRANEVVNFGHNIGPGGGPVEAGKAAHRIGMESNYYPEVGKWWQEFHLGAYSIYGGDELRYLSMEMDVDRTDGSDNKLLRLRLAADILNITNPEANQEVVVITGTNFQLRSQQAFDTNRRDGVIVQARKPGDGAEGGGTFPLVTLDSARPGAVLLGEPTSMLQTPDKVLVGDYNTAARMTLQSAFAAGAQPMLTLKAQGIEENAGVAIVGANEVITLGKLSFVIKDGNGTAVYVENKVPGVTDPRRSLGIYHTGDVEVLVQDAGLIQKSANGSRWRLVVSNAGVVSAVAA